MRAGVQDRGGLGGPGQGRTGVPGESEPGGQGGAKVKNQDLGIRGRTKGIKVGQARTYSSWSPRSRWGLQCPVSFLPTPSPSHLAGAPFPARCPDLPEPASPVHPSTPPWPEAPPLTHRPSLRFTIHHYPSITIHRPSIASPLRPPPYPWSEAPAQSPAPYPSHSQRPLTSPTRSLVTLSLSRSPAPGPKLLSPDTLSSSRSK